jgi:Domain of unknown function (DUF4397)
MFDKLFHPASLAVHLFAAAAVLAILTGCQAISSAPQSQLRIIAASADTPGFDLYRGSAAVAFNLDFGTVTSYVPLTPGLDTISAETAGTKQVLSSSKATLAASTQYTVLIGNSASSLQQLVLVDQGQPAPPGQIALRFIDQATRAGAVDIYLVPAGQKLTAVTPLITGVPFGANTGYLNIPIGTYTIVMVPTGTPVSATAATYTGPQVNYSAGSARTVILIDQQPVTAAGLQVITADDYTPSPAN